MRSRFPNGGPPPPLSASLAVTDSVAPAMPVENQGGPMGFDLILPPRLLMEAPESRRPPPARCLFAGTRPMKIRNSLKSLRERHRDNQIVRRKGRVYIINKTQKRYKARQG